ncbi:MAG: SDR family oxidoreductase [Bacteroidales bacterium]
MKDKVVIVTGASSGIGKACVYRFANQGAKVIFGARNKEKIEEIALDLKNQHKEVIAVQTDVSDPDSCKNLIDTAVKNFGKIDVLINNAGVSMRGLFENTGIEVIKKLMDINFWGTVYCTKFALPYLLETKGSVIGVSSIAGFQGLPGRTGYSSSKFAMHGFLETLRIETLKKGLHVLVAAPGFTATNVRKSALGPDGNPQGESPRNEHKMMKPEDVAKVIEKGIKKRRRTIIMTTEGKLTVFLNRIIPKYMDKLTYKHLAKEPNSPFS